MTQTILVVDDDPVQRRLLSGVTEKMGFAVAVAEGGRQALDLLGAHAVDLVLLDLLMPGVDGIAVLKGMRERGLEMPVIVLTAQGGIETAVGAMRAGANDFLVKPASPERIQVSIKNALKINTLADEVQRLKRKERGQMRFNDLVGTSNAMRQVVKLAERAAQSTIPILIEGESGVGKELVARAIQGASDRAGRPFVTLNCGAIPENLVESILFGHEKGAFTGATDRHVGKFQEADGGTLFLDEIGELSLAMQVKLLRALQQGEVDPVGARRPVRVDVRIISATNRDLWTRAQEGHFREDLYYRLNVFPIRVPPLRERRTDIPALLDHFVRRFAAEEKKRIAAIDPRALEVLAAYAWPGNVRQLENAVFRAVVLAESDVLGVGDFPQIAGFMGAELRRPEPVAEPASVAPAGQVFAGPVSPPAIAPMPASPFADATPLPPLMIGGGQAGIAVSDVSGGDSGLRVTDAAGHMRPIEEIEGEIIRMALDRYRGRMSEVARRLGIGRSTLYRKVRDLGLDVRGEEESA